MAWTANQAPDLSNVRAALARGIVEIIRAGENATFSNSGITSRQLLFPENSRSKRITVTRATVAPGATNPPHRNASSEQVWVALRGKGLLLLGDGKTLAFSAGDIVRFEDNEFHGFEVPAGHPPFSLSVAAGRRTQRPNRIPPRRNITNRSRA